MRRIACTAVSNMVSLNDKLFSYYVPDTLSENVVIGSQVIVPFGKSNKKSKGIVIELKEDDGSTFLKPIMSVIDNSTHFTDETVKLVEYIKRKCFCSYYDAAKLFIPYGSNYNIDEELTANAVNIEKLSPLESEIYSFVSSSDGTVSVKSIYDSFGDSARLVLGSLTAKGYLTVKSTAKKNIKDLTVKMVSLAVCEGEISELTGARGLGEKQLDVIEFLKENGEVSAKELCYMTGALPSTVNSLEKRGIVNIRIEDVYRLPAINADETPSEIVLNKEQNAVFENIINSKGYSPFLLRGVTGSGKTQVYIKLCRKYVEEGKKVIILIPEIALTSQIISRFYGYFGRKIAIIHSGLSIGEKSDEWRRLKNGEAVIAIGTRSAVFAPVSNIGIIIMDEEQEHTYKSEMTPKYSAKDIAVFRAKYNKCPVLFASATPSVATYAKAKNGSYKLLTIEKRYNNSPLPSVSVVDMRHEVENGNTGIISDELRNEISKNLKNGEQTLLFLNRRGFNWFISCRNCGATVTCPKCSISLTYHSENGRLMCHHCGYSIEKDDTCPVCKNKSLKFFGTGTQRVVSELELLFPEAKIMRLDADTTTKKNSHNDMLAAFANHDGDILVGTQMIAKGLDFPDVTLAAVLMADFSIYADDYKANEKTFEQITQVIGRAGRAKLSGRAIVQTFAPDNRIVSLAVSQDYEAFYSEEIALRHSLVYPPYCDIFQITFESQFDGLTLDAAKFTASEIARIHNEDFKDMPVIGLGPSQARIYKINNYYRYKLILKCRINDTFYAFADKLIYSFSSEKKYKNVTMSVEINPETII